MPTRTAARTALLLGLAAVATVPLATPATASVPRPDLPCQVVVPSTAVIGENGATVTAQRGDCPSLLRDPSWQFGDASGEYAFSFSYDADAVYPSREMTTKIYSWDGPGRYRLVPQQTQLFEDPSVGDFGEYYEVPMTASNDILAKYAANVAVSVTHRGTGASRTTTITARARRVARFGTEPAARQGVRVLRDGKAFKSGVVGAGGTASWTFADRSGTHSYGAVLPESGTTWAATARTVRG